MSNCEPTRYRIRLYTQFGDLLNECLLDNADHAYRVEYVRTINDIGVLTIELPFDRYPESWLAWDNYFEVLRSVDGAAYEIDLQTRWFIQSVSLQFKGGGYKWVVIAFDNNVMLRWRINAHYADLTDQTPPGAASPESAKTLPADDMIKQIARENATATAFAYSNAGSFATIPPNRNLAQHQVAPNTTQAPIVSHKFAHRPLLDIYKEICRMSSEQSTPRWLCFDMVWDGSTTTLQTFIDQRGVDRRTTINLSPGRGISEATRDYDYRDAYSLVYTGGEGTGNIRNVDYRLNLTMFAASLWGWREKFVDAKDKSGLTYLGKDSEAAIALGKPKFSFGCTVTQQNDMLYGRDYQYGDHVAISFGGSSFDARINSVRVTLQGGSDKVVVGMTQTTDNGMTQQYVGTHMLADPSEALILNILQQINRTDYYLRRQDSFER